MSILGNKNKLSLPTALGLGTTIIGAGGNLLGQLLGIGTDGKTTKQNEATSNINTFSGMRDNLAEVQIAFPSLDTVTVAGTGTPNSVRSESIADRLIPFYAESVNLPGVNIITGSTRPYGFGPNVPYARDVSFNDVAVTFIGDGAGAILKQFTKWMNGIVKFDDYLSPVIPEGPVTPFFFRYKQQYVAKEFKIIAHNESRDQVAVYYLEDAFPTSISDINMSWGNTNQLARFTVNFTYTRWVHKSAVTDLTTRLNLTPRGDTSTLSMLFQAGTAATTLASLGKPRNVGDVINVVSQAARIFK